MAGVDAPPLMEIYGGVRQQSGRAAEQMNNGNKNSITDWLTDTWVQCIYSFNTLFKQFHLGLSCKANVY